MEIKHADVAELVDARDLKSLDGNVVRVRVPPPAPAKPAPLEFSNRAVLKVLEVKSKHRSWLCARSLLLRC
jgi:hypothetical protein